MHVFAGCRGGLGVACGRRFLLAGLQIALGRGSIVFVVGIGSGRKQRRRGNSRRRDDNTAGRAAELLDRHLGV